MGASFQKVEIRGPTLTVTSTHAANFAAFLALFVQYSGGPTCGRLSVLHGNTSVPVAQTHYAIPAGRIP
jgi:hypothetical protein